MVKKEPTRKNGYYQSPNTGLWYPSVTTIQKSCSDGSGLINWAAQQGARAVIYALSKYPDIEGVSNRIQSSAALDWAVDIGTKGLKDASAHSRNFGTAVHAAVDEFTRTGKYAKAAEFPDWDDQRTTAVEAFISFHNALAETGAEVTSSEAAVVNETERYAGRLDQIWKFQAKTIDMLQPFLYTKTIPVLQDGSKVLSDLKTGRVYLDDNIVQLSGYAKAIQGGVDGAMVVGIDRSAPDVVRAYFITKEELEEAYEEAFKPALKLWRYQKAPKWWRNQFP